MKRSSLVFTVLTIFSFVFLASCSDKVVNVSVPDHKVNEGESIEINLVDFVENAGKSKLSFYMIEGVGEIHEGKYMYVPGFDASGQKTIKFAVKNEEDNITESSFVLNVINVNRPPIAELPEKTLKLSELPYEFDLLDYCSDPDGDQLFFSIVEGPAELVNSNFLRFAQETVSVGKHNVIVTVSDNENGVTETVLSLNVLESPVITGKELTVGGDKEGRYKTIQEAVNVAKSGDTVVVMPGVYDENITASKSVRIIGLGNRDEIVIAPTKSESAGIYIRNGDGFLISNLTIKTDGLAIQISRSSGEIIDCVVFGGRFGISSSGEKGKSLLVSDCFISAYESLHTEEKLSERLTGLYVYGSGTIEVRNNEFIRNGTGVYISNDTEFTLSGNLLASNTIGISITGTATGKVLDNKVTGNLDNGLLLRSTSTVDISNNAFYGNARHGFDLYLRQCTDCGCGGTVFKGTVTGSGNVFDSDKALCPLDYNWPDNFFSVDADLISQE